MFSSPAEVAFGGLRLSAKKDGEKNLDVSFIKALTILFIRFPSV